MSSTPTSLAVALANVSTLTSFAVVIYTTNNTTATTAISAKGEDKVEEEDEDEFDNAISKSILLSRF
jgi:hypothetical protein